MPAIDTGELSTVVVRRSRVKLRKKAGTFCVNGKKLKDHNKSRRYCGSNNLGSRNDRREGEGITWLDAQHR
jgi:hypothetical protein